MKVVEITNETAKLLADFLRSKIASHSNTIEQLVAEKRAWESQLTDLSHAINGHGQQDPDVIDDVVEEDNEPEPPAKTQPAKAVPKKYNPDWIFAEKVRYILNKENRPMTTAMVVAAAIAIEPRLGGKNQATTMKSISRALAIGVKKKEYSGVENPKGGRRLFKING